ncbi:MAG: hypothetical protein JW902_12870 [Syntrophaceae bacterium]|nr:hypothetical protein [Syntrophaceae bacterium]
MKVKGRQQLYGNLTDAQKRKKAIEWCMRFLWLDMDSMSDPEFVDMVTEYECIVAYPGDLGYHFFPTPSVESIEDLPDPAEQMRDAREQFKVFQNKAKDILSDFEGMIGHTGRWLKIDTTMQFTVRVGPSGQYAMTEKDEHDFEYSLGRQLALLLDGKKFDEVIRECPVCGHSFAILTKHRKQCCSNRCAAIHVGRKKMASNPEGSRKQRNLDQYFHDLKKRRGYKDQRIRYHLENYIRDRSYAPEEIPLYIKRFLSFGRDDQTPVSPG